jgi:hypothetical protein
MSSTFGSAASSFLGMPNMAGLFSRRARKRRPAARTEPTLRIVKPKPASEAPVAFNVEKILAAAKRPPLQLTAIEWDGDAGARGAQAPSAAPSVALPVGDSLALDARCRKLRDRYVSARFPGVIRSALDLECAELVIKSARLFFEDGQNDLALELLDLAVDSNPRCEAIPLAQLEILFLARAAARYAECAAAFRAAHPASDAWAEVKRLGQALAPGEPLFGVASGPREHEHYGPWPHLPNWIQASWDLTAEVVAADFHRAVIRMAPLTAQSAA